ncbi:MAG TPA: DoxX family protein [Urbifossiella sp.]|nr:DoxX family protein [Urbifossiella sp.]
MARTIAYWVTTALLGLGYLMGGFANLVQPGEFATDVAKLGYPLLFFRILGVWKLAGAVVVLAPGLPRAKEWAYAGFVINLTAAAATHVGIGDPPQELIAPAVLLAFAVASWALRPASRRLAGPCV